MKTLHKIKTETYRPIKTNVHILYIKIISYMKILSEGMLFHSPARITQNV